MSYKETFLFPFGWSRKVKQEKNEEQTLTWSSFMYCTQRMQKGGSRYANPSRGGLEQLVTNYKGSFPSNLTSMWTYLEEKASLLI